MRLQNWWDLPCGVPVEGLKVYREDRKLVGVCTDNDPLGPELRVDDLVAIGVICVDLDDREVRRRLRRHRGAL